MKNESCLRRQDLRWRRKMLKVQNLHQYYGGSHILRDVSLQAEAGKVMKPLMF